jgi:hypothetical protein
MLSGGNVGINQTTPTAPLDVGGPIRSESNVASTSTFSAANSTTPANVTSIVTPTLLASKTYIFNIDLMVTASASYGIKCDMGQSTNLSSIYYTVEYFAASSTAAAYSTTYNSAAGGLTAAVDHVHIHGSAIFSATAGVLGPQCAQNASGSTATTVPYGTIALWQTNQG